MTLGSEVKKWRDSKAFYAVAGAGDLAAEKLRGVPGQLKDMQTKTGAQDLRGAARTYANRAGARASALIDGLAERGKNSVRPSGPRAVPDQLESPAATRSDAGPTDGPTGGRD